MAYIQSYKGQSWLLPPSIEDLIPDDHICFLVEGLVDSLDYSTFDIRYSGVGHPAHHPRILLKLLVGQPACCEVSYTTPPLMRGD